jgi:class 3 adenylate cyclase
MFTDIVKSTDLVGVIGDEAWENLLAWHDQALRSLFASHGGEVAHHTGDGVLRGLR